MEPRYTKTEDGAQILDRTWKKNAPDYRDEEGEWVEPPFHYELRAVVARDKDHPGTWMATLQERRVDHTATSEELQENPWLNQAFLVRGMPYEDEARRLAFAGAMRLTHEDPNQGGSAEFFEPGLAKAERDWAKTLSASEDKFGKCLTIDPDYTRHDADKNEWVPTALILDQEGYFRFATLDDTGIPAWVDDTQMTMADPLRAHAFAPGDIKTYEGRKARPATPEMKAGFEAAEGNVATYAIMNEISLVDALRDGLMAGVLKLDDPLVVTTMKHLAAQDSAGEYADTEWTKGNASRQDSDHAQTLAQVRFDLRRAEMEGLNVREEYMTLAAIGRHGLKSRPGYQAASELVASISRDMDGLGLPSLMNQRNASLAERGVDFVNGLAGVERNRAQATQR